MPRRGKQQARLPSREQTAPKVLVVLLSLRAKEARANGAGKGGLNKFVKEQRRKRWCRHLQRVCGTKQIWEVLAFSGYFHVDMLQQALHNEPKDETAVPPARGATSHEERRRLHHAKAEARARFNKGQRLARRREELMRDGASQPVGLASFTRKELEVLRQWDNGELRDNRNMSIVAFGHGRLRTAGGDYMDIGGSTGGGSRRIIDGWQPPDWRHVLDDE